MGNINVDWCHLVPMVLLGLLASLLPHGREIYRGPAEFWSEGGTRSSIRGRQCSARPSLRNFPGHVCSHNVSAPMQFKKRTFDADIYLPLVLHWLLAPLQSAAGCCLALPSCSSGRPSSTTRLLAGLGTHPVGCSTWVAWISLGGHLCISPPVQRL